MHFDFCFGARVERRQRSLFDVCQAIGPDQPRPAAIGWDLEPRTELAKARARITELGTQRYAVHALAGRIVHGEPQREGLSGGERMRQPRPHRKCGLTEPGSDDSEQQQRRAQREDPIRDGE
jgi:hypothetical protein